MRKIINVDTPIFYVNRGDPNKIAYMLDFPESIKKNWKVVQVCDYDELPNPKENEIFYLYESSTKFRGYLLDLSKINTDDTSIDNQRKIRINLKESFTSIMSTNNAKLINIHLNDHNSLKVNVQKLASNNILDNVYFTILNNGRYLDSILSDVYHSLINVLYKKNKIITIVDIYYDPIINRVCCEYMEYDKIKDGDIGWE